MVIIVCVCVRVFSLRDRASALATFGSLKSLGWSSSLFLSAAIGDKSVDDVRHFDRHITVLSRWAPNLLPSSSRRKLVQVKMSELV